MADPKRMEKVDMAKEFSKLSESDQYFVRKLEQMNRDRARDMKALRRKNWITGLAIGAGVLSIYFYSMYAVRQERFLADFDKVPDKK
ncbi:hypothetical protein BaRGS_00020632 [Batillaria attramentaria]|uniref:Cytochrome c oxidase assembly factor 3 n=1 Tax=Batillaria attramentaria TaxID=370345 RepID=A0ABD0KLU7_9CAEN